MAAPRYLLDTNILVHHVRASAVWIRVRDEYQPLTATQQPSISVVTVGELRSLAMQWNWGASKLDRMEFALDYFKVQDILDDATLRMYATLDSFCEGIGQPMGKNDVWIAATAAVTGATLLTTDRDFDRLCPQFLTRVWISPDTKSS